MTKEKMAELKIMVPARWLPFIDEVYSIGHQDANKELRAWIKEAVIADFCENVGARNRPRLIEKHRVEDIYPIPQWVRDEASGISQPVEPA